MLALQIVTLIVLGSFMAVFLYRTLKSQGAYEPDVEWMGPVSELERRLEALETKWITTRDELQERLETGQEAWRKVRQREGIRRRREEAEAEAVEQGEMELADRHGDQLPLGVDDGVPPEHTEPEWMRVRRELANHIASGGSAP